MAADLLKDLPSRNRSNFSQYSQGSFKNAAALKYVRLREEGEEGKALVIETDHHSMIRREMEKLQRRQEQQQQPHGRKHSLGKRDPEEACDQQSKQRRTDSPNSSPDEPD